MIRGDALLVWIMDERRRRVGVLVGDTEDKAGGLSFAFRGEGEYSGDNFSGDG